MAPMEIRFGDHASFHRAALGMVGGALLTGIALRPFTSLAPLVGGVAGMAIGAAIGYGHAKLRLAFAALAILPLLATKLAWVSALPSAVPLVTSASLLALAFAPGGPRGIRGALGVGLSALVALVAMWCAMRFMTARETMTWNGGVLTGLAAASMGMVGVIAMLPRHLRLTHDPVQQAVRQLPGLEPEIKTLCDRALAIWGEAKEKLADEGGKNLVRDGVLKTLEVAQKSTEIKLTGASDADLIKRMTDLDTRIAASSDPEAKSQYQQARSALEDQRRYREHIVKGRERLVARMHNHVAALEKYQLAATGLEAVRQEGSPAMKQLAELSQNVAASGEALAELEIGEAPVVTEAVISMTREPDAESNALA